MTSVAVADAEARPITRARTKTTFYVALSIFMVGIVFAGFWPSYYGPLMRGDADRPVVVHIHGAVFIGWMALVVAQLVTDSAAWQPIGRAILAVFV